MLEFEEEADETDKWEQDTEAAESDDQDTPDCLVGGHLEWDVILVHIPLKN